MAEGILGARLDRAQLEQIREALGSSLAAVELTASLAEVVDVNAPAGPAAAVREAVELVDQAIDDLVARQQDAYRALMRNLREPAPDALARLVRSASERLPQVPLERAVPLRLNVVSKPLDLGFSERQSRRIERRYRQRREALFPNQRAAQRKARDLLLAGLTPEQRQTYQLLGSFDVTGGATGTRYRIVHGQVQNILELDDKGAPVRRWCCHPPDVPEEDAMLAQKLHLEENEDVFIQTANLIGGPRREDDHVAGEAG